MNHPVIVAEIGASHNGKLARTLDTVTAAARAGANAIKLQTYTPDTMVADRTWVIPDGPWKGRNLYQLYREAAMPWDWQPFVFKSAQAAGMLAFSTPFDETAVDFLEGVGCPMFKVASFEITDHQLIRKIATTGKPIIISTGMATAREIREAIAAANGCEKITLLKCTSAYPAPIEEMNLCNIPMMREFYRCHIGLSDHTIGPMAAVVATALGATMIEKHITLTHEAGPDDAFAVTPDEFAVMVRHVREAAQSMGHPVIGPTESEQSSITLRRGLYAARDIEAGKMIEAADIKVRRPMLGLPASDIDVLLFSRLTRAIKAGEPFRYDDMVHI